MEPIFAQLSLEYLLSGKNLPWNKQRQQFRETLLTPGRLTVVKADVSKARSYFSL